MIKGVTAAIAIVNVAFYILYVSTITTLAEKQMRAWTFYYAVSAECSIAAFLFVMARKLKKISRKQFKKKEMPSSVR